jgi:hypothetical protein
MCHDLSGINCHHNLSDMHKAIFMVKFTLDVADCLYHRPIFIGNNS